MTKFGDLFWSHREMQPGQQQRFVEAHFPDEVAVSNLRLWQPGNAVPTTGKRFLIGVATYSVYDMRLLDVVDEFLGQGKSGLFQVDVFSVAQCKSQEDFGKYISDLGTVLQTPVVGLWEEGALTEKAQGKAGRDLILQVCGLDPAVEKQIVSLHHLA
jgi:hypothetical protein